MVPAYGVDDADKMIYLLFDRQHQEDDIVVFVRPNSTQLVRYLVFFKADVLRSNQKSYYSFQLDSFI